jgi:hypothetical protein
MNHKCLLTPYIIGEELRFQMRNAGMATTDPQVKHVFRPGVSLALDIQCGGFGTVLELRTTDLLMNIDDFSERHIMPNVAWMKSQRTPNAEQAST